MRTTRRQFLGTTAGAGAAAMLPYGRALSRRGAAR